MKKILLIAIALCVSIGIQAQTAIGTDSPYSRYGFGLMGDQAVGCNKGLAGLSMGLRGGRSLNIGNPASYSAIDSLSFLLDMGLSVQSANFSNGKVSDNRVNGDFDYLVMGFRASKGLGLSLGVTKLTSIGYDIVENGKSLTSALTGDITPAMKYTGEGGLHEVYLGAGYRPFRHLSLGVNAGYMWGTLSNAALTSYSESSVQSLGRNYYAEIRSYKVDFGLQYEHAIGAHDVLVLGATYGLGHDINNCATFFSQTINNNTQVVAGDTLNTANAFQWPHSFGIGLTWQHRGLCIGADYNVQKWSSVKYPTLVTTGGQTAYKAQKGAFDNMTRIAVGAEYIPDANGIRWRSHVRYRVGFAYTSPYYKVNNQEGPQSFLVTAGVGLPVMNLFNNKCIVNLTAQYEHIKPKFAGQITENYIRLCVGVSFNEHWFMKWKVE